MNSLTFRITTALLTFIIGVGVATAWVLHSRQSVIEPVPINEIPSTSSSSSLEMVFVLDTTGSMGGLIEGAKQRIWGIVNEVMQSESRPAVRIGLVAYRDRGDQYVTQVLPLTNDLDKVGTPHFAQFVPLEDDQIGFFTVYHGNFDTYIADFTKNIGEVFDLLFRFIKGAPPSPCRKHLQEFIDFVAGANRTPIGFYQAYPGLSVQDIHALIADRKTARA